MEFIRKFYNLSFWLSQEGVAHGADQHDGVGFIALHDSQQIDAFKRIAIKWAVDFCPETPGDTLRGTVAGTPCGTPCGTPSETGGLFIYSRVLDPSKESNVSLRIGIDLRGLIYLNDYYSIRRIARRILTVVVSTPKLFPSLSHRRIISMVYTEIGRKDFTIRQAKKVILLLVDAGVLTPVISKSGKCLRFAVHQRKAKAFLRGNL